MSRENGIIPGDDRTLTEEPARCIIALQQQLTAAVIGMPAHDDRMDACYELWEAVWAKNGSTRPFLGIAFMNEGLPNPELGRKLRF